MLQGECWVSIVVHVIIPDLPSALTVVLGQEQLARAENINTSLCWPLSFSFHVGLGSTPERAKAHNEPGNYQPPRAGSKYSPRMGGCWLRACLWALGPHLHLGYLPPSLLYPQQLKSVLLTTRNGLEASPDFF